MSLRSKHVDVSEIAVSFDGGGHILASGFSFDFENVLSNVLKEVLKVC